MTFSRYAIFYVPPADEKWARSCTNWLGWDLNNSRRVAHPEIAELPISVAEITQTPRRYGLHATLKPPFRLAPGQSETALKFACAALANDQQPVLLQSLAINRMGRFLALCPNGETNTINTLAARCVSELDSFRATLTVAELDRRRGSGLSIRQEHNLTRWGYPHVMDLFRFHITLTGRLPKITLETVAGALNDMLSSNLPSPMYLSDLALVGEDDEGMFHLINRYPLAG